MDSMKCWDCLLKHIAAAVSYGKEVMSGHSRGNELDHRIDFLGEIVNAEQHAEMLDGVLLHKLSVMRKVLQNTHVSVDTKTIDTLRQLYIETENQQEIEDDKISSSRAQSQATINRPAQDGKPGFVPVINNQGTKIIYRTPLDVVYADITNIDFFRFSYSSMKHFFQPHGNVYALKSSVDLAKYPEFSEVKVVNKSLIDFCKLPEVSADFLFMKENMGWVNPEDGQKVMPLFSNLYNNEMTKTKQELRRTGTKDTSRVYDNMKPQPVNKDIYAVVMKPIGETAYPLAHYYTLTTAPYVELATSDRLAIVDRPVCCSTKGKLRTGIWAVWTNQENFASMLSYLQKERGYDNVVPSPQPPALPKPITPADPVPEQPPAPPASMMSSAGAKN